MRRAVALAIAFSAQTACTTGGSRGAPDAADAAAPDASSGSLPMLAPDAEALPACPASPAPLDNGGVAPDDDAGILSWTAGTDASLVTPSGLAVRFDSGLTLLGLFPMMGSGPSGGCPVQGMSPVYGLYVSPPEDVTVTIPLAPPYAGCEAALYVQGSPTSPWKRAGAFSNRTVSGVVSGQSPNVLLVAGTCASECGGVCVDFTTDSNNCGACGNVCAPPIFCVLGACSGEKLSSTGGKLDSPVALDTDHVYFVASSNAGDQIVSLPKSGGDATVLAPGAGVTELVAQGGSLFWSEAGGLGSMTFPNGTPHTIGGGPPAGFTGPFVVVGSNVYFGATNAVESLPVTATDASGLSVVASLVSAPAALATDGQSLLWIDGAGLERLALTDGGAGFVTIASDAMPSTSLLVDSGFAYFFASPAGSPATKAVAPPVLKRVPVAGGMEQLVASIALPNTRPYGFAVGAGAVAWLDDYSTGALWAQKAGGTPEVVWQPIELMGLETGSIAGDGTGIYAVGSGVWRLPWPK